VTDRPVVFDVDPRKIVRDHPLAVQLISHTIVPRVISNPYGEIQSGSLVLKGFTRSLIRSKQQVMRHFSNDNEYGLARFDDANGGDNMYVFLVDGKEGHQLVAIRKTSEKEADLEIDRGLYCAEEYILMYILREWLDLCLILKPSNLPHSNTYERIGIFEAWRDVQENVEDWEVQTIILI
jgi:hypothetical protein